ncbi:MAG: hypothetical protein IIB77_11885 [Proteobacteria bacterium]|nr:hypothetical protein [Pseudomonadota bacterium]
MPQEPVTVRRLLLKLTVILTLFFGVASAQDAAQPDPLFLDNTALAVTITAPLTTLVRERPKDDYLQGVFEYTGADGSAVKLDIEIRTRGHFRHATCDFPPLGLNFRKKQVSGTLFDQQNKLKLVVHCDNHVRFEQNVLREYLAYRIHNSITDLSYHVRLLRVTYVDSEGRRKDQVRYAYLIEHKNRLAARLGLDVIERERIKVSSIQGDQLNLTSVFQYLIGNTDFSPIAGAPGRGGVCGSPDGTADRTGRPMMVSGSGPFPASMPAMKVSCFLSRCPQAGRWRPARPSPRTVFDAMEYRPG